VATNLSISLIENEYLLKMIDRQSLLSAHKATERLNKMFLEQKELLKNYFQQIESEISFTFDVWTSNSSVNYLGMCKCMK